MHSFVGPRLSVMMFIQFFIWGAWYVTAPRVLGPLGFSATDFAWTYSVGPIAGMISPFFVGMIADRFFSTERVLAVMHLGAGAAMFGAIAQMGAANPSPNSINLLFFVHMLCYFPTLALTNSLAMNTMTDSEKQFPIVRVFGTIGWIVAGFTLDGFGIIFDRLNIETWEWGASINMFYLAGGAAILMGLFSFTLPHTPPPQAGKKVSARELLGLDAFVLLKNRSFLIFMVSSFLICIPLAFYYQMAERAAGAAGLENTPTKMSFGQISEIVFMLLMPLFFKRLGVKWMLLIGMLAWVARYLLFAIGTSGEITSMIIVGIILHGICYDFFFVTGQIYTDKVAPPEIRAQAQGMLVLFTLGLGMLIGAQVCGQVEKAFTPPEVGQKQAEAAELGVKIEELERQLAGAASDGERESFQNRIDEMSAKKEQAALQSLKLIEWRSIWIIPAVGAAVIMLLFAMVFKVDSTDDRLDVKTTEASAEQ